MTKLIVLKLDGDLQKGVRVTLSIAYEGVSPHKEVTGNLQPVAPLETTIDDWRLNYRSLGSSNRALKAIKVTYSGSISQKQQECKNSAIELQKRLNNWLRKESFRPIREAWLKEVQESDYVRVLIRTSSQQLRQIPWHLWDLVEEYPNVELALSATDYQKNITTKTPTYRDKVKILAILGNSTGIDVETDCKLLNSLPDADITFLVEPQRQEINDSLWERPWDILFFAGHSQTVGDSGRIYINENRDCLTIDDLKYGLKKATSNGLSVAIFNSCDGLGLASSLEALHIPQVIVMREQVPDEVAQLFLKHFLLAFANNSKPLYQAAKEARLKLHGLEDKYPCASWLPVICQNADTVSLLWSDLGKSPTQINPYRGLFAFREEDAQFFFGRETFTDMLVDAVQNQPLVAVVGSSGSGKSSVVFAGLVRRLRVDNWHIVDFRPGSRPLFNLASSLVSTTSPPQKYQNKGTEHLRETRNLADDFRQHPDSLRDVIDDFLLVDPSQHFLLIADQFEELYTMSTDAQERQAFLDRLLEAIHHCSNFSFVITLRADFLGQALSYRPFADALQYADLKLGPMTDSELFAAIEKPAKKLGVTIEEGLVERILTAVSAEPGNLPLLEFALTQLWVKQVDAQLTHKTYDQIGGVEAALALYADQTYNKLNFEQKERAQRIFIQLVHPGLGAEDTRRVATRTEVGEENWDLVTRLANARLVVTGRDEKTGNETVEIVHEALIRSWLQLNLWMQLDRDFRHWQESLRAAMRTWKSSGFDEGALLRGKPLADAQYWQDKRFLELSGVERSFIGLSVELRKRESNKQKRRRRLTILGLSFGLVIALSLAGVAGWQWQNSAKSEINALSASSEALFASNQQLEGLTTAIRAGKQLQLPWVKTDTQTTVINALQNALYRTQEYNRLQGHRSGAYSVAFSHDGKMIASLSKEGTVKLWKPDGALLDKLWLNNLKDVSAVAISSKKQLIATASDDTVTLWTLDGVKQKILSGHKGEVGAIAFSPNSEIIAIATTKVEGSKVVDTLQLWNTDNGTLRKSLEGVYVQMTTAFSPDGEIIASGGWGGIKLWKIDSSWQKTLQGFQKAVTAVSFSTDGKMITAASADKNAYIWKTDSTGEYETKPYKTLAGHNDAVWGVNFSPDSELIASASGDKTVKIWKPDGTLVTTLKGHRDVVRAVAFSPDAKTLASASDDGSVKLWKPEGTSLKALKHESQVYAVAYSPDGKKIVTTNGHGYVSLWQDNGKLLKTEKWQEGPVHKMVFSPNGELIVTASSDRSVQIRSSDGAAAKFLEGHTGELNQKVIFGASFSPDSHMIATGSEDGAVQLWTTDGKLYKTLQANGDKVWGVSFSPNGELIASAHNNGTVKLWKVNGTLLTTLSGHRNAVRAVTFSPDSQIIATASNDNTAKLWKLDGTLLKTLSGHRNAVRAVTFSPDSRIIATASNDNTVKLWKPDSTLLKTLSGHTDIVRAIFFSPDGKTLLSGSKDESVILWKWQENLDIKQLLVLGCDWVGDYLKTNPNVSNMDKYLCN